MSFYYSPKIVTNGLVFYLDAQNPDCYSGQTRAFSIAKREVGSTFSRLNFIGGMQVVSNNNLKYFQFDGTDDYLSALGGGTPLVNIPANLTYESWFSHDRLSAQGSVLYLPGPGSNSNRTWLYPYGNNINLALTDGTAQFGVTYNQFTDVNFPNEFNHVVATCQLEPTLTSSTLTIYVNGTLVRQLTNQGRVSGRVSGPNEPDIGRGTSTGSARFKGKIATASIYNRALSLNEIRQNYNALKGRFGF